MKVKVQCDCGTRFEFEVEPVNERMPVAIACPGCNADATPRANEVIRAQLSAPPPSQPIPRVSMPRVNVRQTVPPPQPTPAPQAAPAQTSGLRISKPAALAAPVAAAAPVASAPAAAPAPSVAAPDDGAPKLCPRHKTEPAYETCVVCGKPICPKCMEQFGYVCSVYCKSQAASKRIYVPAYAHQKSEVEARSRSFGRLITAGVILLLLVFAGLWYWYAFYARNPKVVYSLLLPKADAGLRSTSNFGDFYELIGPDELLSIKNKQVALMKVTEEKQVWSAPLQSEADLAAAKAARAKLDESRAKSRNSKASAADEIDIGDLGPDDSFAYFDPHIIATTNEIWICGRDRVARFDRATGSRKDVPLKDKILDLTFGSDSIVALCAATDGHQTLTRIALTDGSAQTEDVAAPAGKDALTPKSGVADKSRSAPAADSANAAKSKAIGAVIASAQSGALNNRQRPIAPAASQPPPASPDDEDLSDLAFEDRHPFIPAGPNAVQLGVKMLEHKTVTREAMKAKGKSILENNNVTASQGLDLAQEMVNDMQREESGGKEVEDVSRYQVTLHRYFSKDAPDWSGEVIGPPAFFPAQTVDVLAAGQSIYVFNKQNKKLWEAKLTYPVDQRFETGRSPVLETKDSLFIADLGMLTCFDLATGTARWRKNSVGISHLQADDRGRIYVNTTTAGPEHIRYSQQVNIHEKIYPLVLQLDPKTGKELWRQESAGDDCMLSGKFVYCTRRSSSVNILRLEEGPDSHYNLSLISPSSGEPIWNFHKKNRPVLKTEVQKNWILLQYDDEVTVMKFFSL